MKRCTLLLLGSSAGLCALPNLAQQAPHPPAPTTSKKQAQADKTASKSADAPQTVRDAQIPTKRLANTSWTLVGNRVQYPDAVPALVTQPKHIARLKAGEKISFAFTFFSSDQAGLDNYLEHLNKPGDPLFMHFLTSEQFAAQFGPTQASYDAVIAFVKANGMAVKTLHSSRLLLDVEADAATTEKVFQTELHTYQAATGRQFRAPNSAPSVPQELATHIAGVVGLDDAYQPHPTWHTELRF